MRPLTWQRTAEGFAAFLKVTERPSDETARTYIARARLFVEWCLDREMDPDDADAPTVAAWFAWREMPKPGCPRPSSYGLRNDLYAVRAYFQYLVWARKRLDNPTDGMKRKKPRTLPKQPMGLEDVKRLSYGASSRRDEAIITFFYSTGARLAEVAGVLIEHIYWDRGVVLIHGKGDKWRPVEPGETTMALLKEIAGARIKGPLWLNKDGAPLSKHAVRQNFWRLAKRKNVRAHPHLLRYTFASSYMEAGGDLGALKELLGHADISTTEHYQQGTALTRGLAAARSLDLGSRIA